ncbi:hypothetical protein [Thermoflexus sp.]|uniref:hypothetical protein n=1 Tax=Thermoflexus sp. TaxID=1969742 RepID=UPI002ADE2A40|nr:hypothetical protein [Thermoflexus sp.]
MTRRRWTWWMPPPERPAWAIAWEGKIEIGPMISEVICDLCNTEIAIRPVPILWGNVAACPACFKRHTGMSVEKAAAMDGRRIFTIDVNPHE